MLENGASSWSDLNLGNQSLVFAKERLELSLSLVDSRVGNSVADVLNNLVLRHSKKSLVVLLNDVESGLKLAKFSSEVGILSNNRVELAVVSASHLSFESAQLRSEVVVLGAQIVDVVPVVVDSVVEIWVTDFVGGLSFCSINWNHDSGVDKDIVLVEILSFNWLWSGCLDSDSDFLLNFDLDHVLDNHIVLLLDDSVNWLLDLNDLLNVDWLLDSSLNFNLNDLLNCNWSLNSSLNKNFLGDDVLVSLLLELRDIDFNDVLLGHRVVLVNNVLNWNLSDLLNWLWSL
jgi:hypothetical protein